MADPVTTGLMVASTAMSAVSGVASAGAQKSGLSARQKMQKSQQALDMAERERGREEELRKTLAKQNAWFAASGTAQNSGSALGIANAARAQMDKQSAMDRRSDQLFQQSLKPEQSSGGNALGGIAQTTNSLLNFAQSGIGSSLLNKVGSMFD